MTAIISLLTFTNCQSDSETEIDCLGSELSLEVSDFEKSDCDIPGSVRVIASGGFGIYQYSLDGENFQSSPDFNDLFAGDFTFLVRDEQGCNSSVSFTLESEPSGITMNLSGTPSGCATNSGTIVVGAEGGTGLLEYSLDGGAFSTNSTFSLIGPGDYTVTVRDEELCEVTKKIKILTNTSLRNDVMPIIMNDCAITSCHNGTQSPTLETTAQVIRNANRIKAETQAGSMPRDRTLTRDEIDLIACWVDDGALDN